MHGSTPGIQDRLNKKQPWNHSLFNVHKIIQIDARDKIGLTYPITPLAHLGSLCYPLLLSLNRLTFRPKNPLGK